MANAIIDTFDLWTTAQNLKTSNRGLSASNQSLLGIKKLRELILELAVRGKLVPQDTNDEPASVLLKKIEKEKRQLIKEGKIKKQDAFLEAIEEKKPFELPKGWEWTRWNAIALKIGDIDHKMPVEVSDGYPYVSPRDFLPNNKIDFKGAKKISEEDFLNLSAKIQPQVGDIIYPRYGTIGENRLVETEIDFLASYSCCIIKTMHDFIHPNFQFLFSISLFVKNQAKQAENKTTQANVGIKSIQNYLVPLPPFQEQFRIVAKVDELMALCDQLEQQQTNNNEAHQTLVDTLLGTLTNAEDPAAFEEAWQRISNHFDTLLTTEHSIDQLKQTILQLAVMGKLVPQNPDDEPASELLKKIAKEKVRLVKEGKIKRFEILPDVKNNEYPFKIPKEWLWQKLGNITTYGISQKAERKDVDSNTWILELEDIEKDTSRILQKVRVSERQFLSSKNKFYPGDVIYGKLRPYLDKVIVADEMGVCTTEMIPLNGYGNIASQYLRLVMKSPYFIKYATESTHGMNLPRLGTDKARSTYFPLPPLSEQHRIVSKVDELFALCDALKERLRDAQALQNQLAAEVVEQAV